MIMWLFYELYALAVGARFIMFLFEVLSFIFVILAIIGLITVIRFFVKRRRLKKETDGEYWRRTGRLREK